MANETITSMTNATGPLMESGVDGANQTPRAANSVPESVGTDLATPPEGLHTSTDGATGATPTAPMTPAEQKISEKLKFLLKIDGKDVEREMTHDEAARYIQLGEASGQRFQEAAAMRKQAEGLVQLLKTNPRAALEHPAIKADIRKLAEEVLSEELENQLADPKDRELKQLKRQLAQREETDRKASEEAKRADAAKQEERLVAEYSAGIKKALTGAGLPITNATVNSMIHYMSGAVDAGHDLPPEQFVDLVKADYKRQLSELFSSSDAETMAQLLGEEGMKKIRGYDLGRLKSPTPPGTVPATQNSAKGKSEKPKRKLSEIFADIRKEIKD
jgi:hypothetical protein